MDYENLPGLTDADIPTTWDELAAVAKKLTQFDENGKMTVAGFNYNEMSIEYLLTALNYHKGIPMFKPGTHWSVTVQRSVFQR